MDYQDRAADDLSEDLYSALVSGDPETIVSTPGNRDRRCRGRARGGLRMSAATISGAADVELGRRQRLAIEASIRARQGAAPVIDECCPACRAKTVRQAGRNGSDRWECGVCRLVFSEFGTASRFEAKDDEQVPALRILSDDDLRALYAQPQVGTHPHAKPAHKPRDWSAE